MTLEFDSKWRNSNYNGHLDSIKINLKRPCEKMPYLNMDESCNVIFILIDYENITDNFPQMILMFRNRKVH